MTPPLTGQRSRSELIAELYERHATGLFAYCHDQLGQTAPAADAVVAVFTTAPTAEPPSRAALYALARREIYRRDVSYALPAVDSVTDPATALIERVFRDIRPHQREVLLLSEVCGLTPPELSVVLDVAVDTAEELAEGAARRFAQTLETAVTAARSAPFVPTAVAEVYDAIGVSPVGDVLARLPWHRPAASVRDRVLTALPYEEPGSVTGPEQSSGLVTKRLWPTTPTWPLPLSDPDQATDTVVVKTDTLAPSQGSRRKARHEATTEPMPRLRGALVNPLAEGRLRRKRSGRPARSGAAESQPALAAPIEPQGSSREPAQTTPATPSIAPAVAETAPDAFDAFGGSEATHRPDPFESFGVTARASDPFPGPGTTPPHPEPFDAFGVMPGPAKDSGGSADTPRAPEPYDAFRTPPRPAEPFDAFGGSATPRQDDPLDALFETLRFAQPFDAFRTAEPAGTPGQAEPAEAPTRPGPAGPAPAAEEAGVFSPAFPPAFPPVSEPSADFPPAPPAEPSLPPAPSMDVFAPAPHETGPQETGPHAGWSTAEPPALAEVPDERPSAGEVERLTQTFRPEPDVQLHPVAAAVSRPLPAASRTPARRHRGKPSGNGASKRRRAKGDRHYDWLWEVVGILICLVIALIVFYFVQ
ncbi:hypothetical protein [Microbispora sp. H11081]|uniref:hypothetical protein n=1 Tax=Microbispora sp. H11081 TaxID=2729107 RepID=UPI00147476D5|nr:hypothetical protein [Microbispora sp. H11081]